jgi:hypothetical protein
MMYSREVVGAMSESCIHFAEIYARLYELAILTRDQQGGTTVYAVACFDGYLPLLYAKTALCI